jgi:hypothetical protein
MPGGDTAERQPGERHSKGGGDVSNCIERAIVGDEINMVTGARGPEPHADGGADPQVSPVLNASHWRTVEEPRSMVRQESRAFVAHDAPIADRDELRAGADVINGEALKDQGHVLRAAAILHIEENRPPRSRYHACLGLLNPGGSKANDPYRRPRR